MNALILGDSGLLGQAFLRQLGRDPKNKILGISSSAFSPAPFWDPFKASYVHAICDVTKDFSVLHELISKHRPDVILNCVAMVNLAQCEDDPAKARELNAELPGKLMELASQTGAKFIHISTDQVFDGTSGSPYRELDPVNPINEYGRSKLAGELGLQRKNPQALIIRTNIVGFRDRAGSPTFAEWLCRALSEGEALTLFTDYVTSSVHVDLVAEVILRGHEKIGGGIINIGSHDASSKYEFGKKLAHRMNVEFNQVKAGKITGSNMRPPRPPYLALDGGKVERVLGHPLPTSNQTIEKLAEDFQFRKRLSAHVSANR